MENLYCTIFIVDVSPNPEEVETVTSRVHQLIEDHGGVVKRNNRWGKRRLAYPIQNRTSGFYVEIEFSANSHLNIPRIIENEYRLNDRVLRYLTYVVTKEELKQREKNALRAAAARDNSGSDSRESDRSVKRMQPERPARKVRSEEAAKSTGADAGKETVSKDSDQVEIVEENEKIESK